MSSKIVIAIVIKITTYIDKDTITNKIVWIRQLTFSHVTFLSPGFIETVLTTFLGIVFPAFKTSMQTIIKQDFLNTCYSHKYMC